MLLSAGLDTADCLEYLIDALAPAEVAVVILHCLFYGDGLHMDEIIHHHVRHDGLQHQSKEAEEKQFDRGTEDAVHTVLCIAA